MRRRLWPRFTLWSLLLLVTGFAIVLGALGRLRPTSEEGIKRAIQLGANVTVTADYATVELYGTPLSDADVEALVAIGRITRLDLSGCNLDDRQLMRLATLKRLHTLNLERTDVGDEGLDALHGLADLRKLKIRRTKVTRAGIARLERALPGCMIDHD